jgi:hypothetical protein
MLSRCHHTTYVNTGVDRGGQSPPPLSLLMQLGSDANLPMSRVSKLFAMIVGSSVHAWGEGPPTHTSFASRLTPPPFIRTTQMLAVLSQCHDQDQAWCELTML